MKQTVVVFLNRIYIILYEMALIFYGALCNEDQFTLALFFSVSLSIYIYEGQSISNETFLITQVCNDW